MDVTNHLLRSRAVSLLRGETTESEFLGWLHDEVGHSGRENLQDLVEMSDVYTLGSNPDIDEWFDNDEAAADARSYVRTSATSLAERRALEPRTPPTANG